MQSIVTYIYESLRIKPGTNFKTPHYTPEQIKKIITIIGEAYKDIFFRIKTEGKITYHINPNNKFQVKTFNESFPENVRKIMKTSKNDEGGFILYELYIEDMLIKLSLTPEEVCKIL
jgi:hypothetical protein